MKYEIKKIKGLKITITLSILIIISICSIIICNLHNDDFMKANAKTLGASVSTDSADFNMNETIVNDSEQHSNSVVLNNFEYFCNLERSYRDDNINATAEDISLFLKNEIANLSEHKIDVALTSHISSRADGKYEIFGEIVTSQEIALVALYPIQSVTAFNASKDAKSKTGYFYMDNIDFADNNPDAFRHSYWNALMERRIFKEVLINTGTPTKPIYSTRTVDFAKAFADAHEYGNTGISTEMDFSNNALGRTDGATFKALDEYELANVMMKRVSFGAYDQIVNGKITYTDFDVIKGEFAFETTDLPNNEIRIDKPILMTDGMYKFPTKINGRILTEIGLSAYQNATMSTVHFNDDSALRVIDSGAFMGCKNLTYINIPPNITDIKTFAFKDCVDLYVYYMGNNLKSIWAFAFENTKVVSEPLFPSSVTYIGAAAFASMTNKSTVDQIIIPSTLADIKSGAFNGNDHVTLYTEFSSKPSGWSSNWNIADRPVVWGCNLSADNSYVVSFYNSFYNISNTNAINGISNPNRSGYTFDGWYTTSNYTGTQYMNIATAPSGNLYAKWTESCVAEGSLITLADGTQVAVEDLTGDEMLLVWNMKTGNFDTAPILFIDNHARTSYSVINLYFSDGTSVKVIDEHAFWNSSLNKYTFLRNDAAKYIGDSFNKQTTDANGNMTWTNVELVDVNITDEVTTAWSPVTYSHLCYYVNGMLSMPGGTTGLINIFEVNPETMTIDMDKYNADIAEYGLFTYEEFAELYPVSEMVFNAFDAQYFKVAIGKGILTFEMIEDLLITYGEFLN